MSTEIFGWEVWQLIEIRKFARLYAIRLYGIGSAVVLYLATTTATPCGRLAWIHQMNMIDSSWQTDGVNCGWDIRTLQSWADDSANDLITMERRTVCSASNGKARQLIQCAAA